MLPGQVPLYIADVRPPSPGLNRYAISSKLLMVKICVHISAFISNSLDIRATSDMGMEEHVLGGFCLVVFGSSRHESDNLGRS